MKKREMEVHNLEGREGSGYVSWGCYWEKGMCGKNTVFLLKNAKNEKIAMQSRVTAWWPDGSIKWTAHVADAGKMKEKAVVVPIEKEPDEKEICDEHKIMVYEYEKLFILDNGKIQFRIPKSGKNLLEQVCVGEKVVAEFADSLLLLEEKEVDGWQTKSKVTEFHSEIEKVSIPECGPIRAVVKYEGIHCRKTTENITLEKKIPFVLYMKVGVGEEKIQFTHTFFYDGDENKDYLKGLGIRFQIPLQGEVYNRHVKFEGDNGCMHEAVAQMLGGKKYSWSVYEEQMKEHLLSEESEEIDRVKESLIDVPYWDTYEVFQDSDKHFGLRKKVADENCCYIDCLSGYRAMGGAAIGSENGSFSFAMRDFWKKYPSGYTFKGLSKDKAEAVVWIWSPQAEAMDFRHYANKGYSKLYYEGYPWKGADPYGIAVTSEFAVAYCGELLPSDERLHQFSRETNKPPQYVGTPEYYHEKRVFGYWSLVKKEKETERFLEECLNQAVDFYLKEAEQRSWYGLFNYGDVMHSYDMQRHVWRYDIGGFAWDNTELVPTYWVWYMFLRTGREDIFSFAEALTRHTSEVDVYHFGLLKGLGSRHNVRHWGCPCKEVRIAMAGHHRFYYYLTGDYRIGDMMNEVADSEAALLVKDPVGAFYEKENRTFPTHARSGPDWSSLCANWMTKWERYQDEKYLKKIKTGIQDIGKAPLKLISGPDFEFDPETCHLQYVEERATGGSHLQICMGAAQIWTELAELIEDKEWNRMLEEYGRFYFLDEAEQFKSTEGKVSGGKKVSFLLFFSGIGAYTAWQKKDTELAKRVWEPVFKNRLKKGMLTGFVEKCIPNKANQQELREIEDISTNNIAQWCLNTIMCLEFIGDVLPERLEEIYNNIRE